VTDLLIHAGRVFTGLDQDAVLQDAWVRVQDGRIAQVSSNEPAAADARRIDAPDATLLPGLIDCHVHIDLSGGPDWLTELREPYAMTCWRAAAHARATLRAGFTSVRSLAGRDGLDPALRDAQRSGLLVGPRIVAANLAICMTGGHGFWLGREADGPEDVRKAVREQLKAGADCIKLIATGGVMTPGVNPGSQQLTDAELCAGVEEGHKAGKNVAAHAHGTDGIRGAVLAGIDSIEHGSFLTGEVIELMRTHGTFFSVTLSSIDGFSQAPPNTVADWALSKANDVGQSMADSFIRAYRAGVRIVLGTDAGTPFNRHGDNAHELELMVRLGMAHVDALRAGTRNSAELLGAVDRVGTIEAGKEADLVLCTGDPTTDVSRLCNQDNIRLVIQAGRIVHE